MIKPKWFIPVACVIFHRRHGSNSEFLLGRRKAKEVEGGKWGLVGGTGAFWEGAENPVDFARREAVYDLKIIVEPERLQYFTEKTRCGRTSLILEVYFSYELEAGQWVEVTGNDKAPEECQWFTIAEIREAAKAGKIAFGNDKILESFDKYGIDGEI